MSRPHSGGAEEAAYAAILRPGFLPDDSDLIPGLIFRWHEPHTETPLSHWNSGVILVAGTGFEPVTFRL